MLPAQPTLPCIPLHSRLWKVGSHEKVVVFAGTDSFETDSDIYYFCNQSFCMNTAESIRQHAYNIRINIIWSLEAAGSGHLGGSLGLADVFSVLYFHTMKHRPQEPEWVERDRLILSIGHVAPVLYAALAEAGYFHAEELLTLRKLGSRLQGHPGRDHGLPGIELSAGSLGQGLGVAVGTALGLRQQQNNARVFCILGDGELQEGSVWEAAMSAAHYKLTNLMAIVDRNGVQIDGPTEKVMSLEPLKQKWEAYGWHVVETDGHDIEELIDAFANPHLKRPTAIIVQTVMGRGIPEIENDYRWHGKAPDAEQAKRFIDSLRNV